MQPQSARAHLPRTLADLERWLSLQPRSWEVLAASAETRRVAVLIGSN